MDMIYVGITLGFFALTYGLMRLCASVGGGR